MTDNHPQRSVLLSKHERRGGKTDKLDWNYSAYYLHCLTSCMILPCTHHIYSTTMLFNHQTAFQAGSEASSWSRHLLTLTVIMMKTAFSGIWGFKRGRSAETADWEGSKGGTTEPDIKNIWSPTQTWNSKVTFQDCRGIINRLKSKYHSVCCIKTVLLICKILIICFFFF